MVGIIQSFIVLISDPPTKFEFAQNLFSSKDIMPVKLVSTIAPLVHTALASNDTIGRQSCTASIGLFHRIHPGIVLTDRPVCFSCEVDWYLESLLIRWYLSYKLPAYVLGDKITSQLGKSILAFAWLPIGPVGPIQPIGPIGPIIRHRVFIEHVGKGLGGVALDVAHQIAVMVGSIEVGRASRHPALP